MTILWIIVVYGFVLAGLAVVVYAVFEMTPYARHVDGYRASRTGRRRWESPHLETRDEFEMHDRAG